MVRAIHAPATALRADSAGSPPRRRRPVPGQVGEVALGLRDPQAWNDPPGDQRLIDRVGPLPRVDTQRGAGVGGPLAQQRGSDREHREGAVGSRSPGGVGADQVPGEVDGGITLLAHGRAVDADEPAAAEGQIARVVARPGVFPLLARGVVHALRARQGGDADRCLAVAPARGHFGPVDQHRDLPPAEGLARRLGVEAHHLGRSGRLQSHHGLERRDERRRVDPGGHRLVIEQEGILVAVLPQARRAGEEDRLAQELRVGPERQRDAMIGRAVTVPVPPLEKAGQRVELLPGLRRLERQRLFLGRGAVGRASESRAIVDQHQGGPTKGEGHPVVAIPGHLIAEGRGDVGKPQRVGLGAPARVAGTGFSRLGGRQVGILRSRGQDQGLGQNSEGPSINQVAEAVAGKNEDINSLERPGSDRTSDHDLSPLARRPFAALRGHGLEEASIAVADSSDRDRKSLERQRWGRRRGTPRATPDGPGRQSHQSRQEQRPTPLALPPAHPNVPRYLDFQRALLRPSGRSEHKAIPWYETARIAGRPNNSAGRDLGCPRSRPAFGARRRGAGRWSGSRGPGGAQ